MDKDVEDMIVELDKNGGYVVFIIVLFGKL